MKDIAPELLARLQADFAARMDKSSRIQTLLQRIRDGTATYIDAEDYSYELGNVLAGLLAGIDPAELPDGRMYYNIADRVLRPLLEQTHDLVAEQSVATLNAMNTAAGIGLKAQPALYDAERVDGIVDLAASRDLYSEVSDKVAAAVTSYAQSVADDTLERTATFLGKAGLRPKIIRKATGKCCKWCRDLAGSYRYPETPEDVFRRHEYCHCTVYYDPGGAKKFQDVHEKQWRNEEERKAVQSRKELEALRTQKTPANRISEINQKNRGKKVMITDQAIRKVRAIPMDGIDADTSAYIQATHRELLSFSRSENFSDEVVGMIDLRSKSRLHFIKGSRDAVNPEADADYYHTLRASPAKSLLLCHNHPGLSYFSLNDIAFFMSYDSIKTMTVVTNQGAVRFISKTSAFDIVKARDCMREATQLYPSDSDELVAHFLKKCYTYGVERN